MLKKLGTYFNPRETAQGNALDFVHLLTHWPSIIGDKLAQVSIPQRIAHKTLTIVVNHSTYAQHLNLLSDEILTKIFKLYPRLKKHVEKIRFQYSEQSFAEVHETKRKVESQNLYQGIEEVFHPLDPKYKKMQKEAEDFFSGIDEDIKKSLSSIYIQNKIKSDKSQ
ncbi:MAG: DUF721 domain-containing protein [Halobacteriovoraceae bacterium]|nr:DUF721 domain-containing protein [Halobacteriovoraceae bacterium]MCB9094163.1 DUF721 domain-containing protein [Halobacteriovoraceae bacterium]